MTKLLRCHIRWNDIYSAGDHWWPLDDALKHFDHAYGCETSGFLIKRTDDYTLICHTYTCDPESGEIVAVMGVLNIPNGAIKSLFTNEI